MAGLRVFSILMLPRLTIPPPVKFLSLCQVLPSASTKGVGEPASIRIALAEELRLAGMVDAFIFVGRVVGKLESAFLLAHPQAAKIARTRQHLIAFMTSLSFNGSW